MMRRGIPWASVMSVVVLFLATSCAPIQAVKDIQHEISDIWAELRGHDTRISRLEKNVIELSLSNDTLFKVGSYKLSETAYVHLGRITPILNEHPGVYVIVEGHTDSTGGRELNMRLSRKRAETVAGVLAEGGFPADHIQTVGYGPDRPVASNSTAEGRGLNRRVTLRISEEQQPLDSSETS